jgi:putative aminopeptidase FrvX
MKNIDVLKHLVETPSPGGNESRVQRIWMNYVSKFTDSQTQDAYGNVVARIDAGGDQTLMISAHADEIGMMVKYIDDDGFIYVNAIGGVDPSIMQARRVQIYNDQHGDIDGVIGCIPAHLKSSKDEVSVPAMSDLFIDIGVSSRKEAQCLVAIGDTITLTDRFIRIGDKIAVARAFDDRVGLFIIAEVARLLRDESLNTDVCIVSNIGEEVGTAGIQQVINTLRPDMALVTDVTFATDYPGLEKTMHGDVKLGHGPALAHGGPNHKEIVALLAKTAQDWRIPVQHEITAETSGTDADGVFWDQGGIPTALVSLPNRYMHSPVELVHLDDIDNTIQLMVEFVKSIKPNHSFRVKI